MSKLFKAMIQSQIFGKEHTKVSKADKQNTWDNVIQNMFFILTFAKLVIDQTFTVTFAFVLPTLIINHKYIYQIGEH